jgi:hypothetical protein
LDNAVQKATEMGGSIKHVYESIKGFSVAISSNSFASLQQIEGVEIVEEDQAVHTC